MLSVHVANIFCFVSVFDKIWEAVDPRQDGYITRDGLYKALALTALAQQGKSISDKVLEQFVDLGKRRASLEIESVGA